MQLGEKMRHVFVGLMMAAWVLTLSSASQARDAVQADLDAAQGKDPQLNRGKITGSGSGSAEKGKPKSVRASKPKSRGSSATPGANLGPDNRQSQSNVCRSQCDLQRMSCDQGRNGLSDGFRNRSDQITASQSSCYLAVQGCLSRC
jgi:hypothetical protein